MVEDAVSTDEEEQMAACGACGASLPIDSKSCPECGVSFSGLNAIKAEVNEERTPIG